MKFKLKLCHRHPGTVTTATQLFNDDDEEDDNSDAWDEGDEKEENKHEDKDLGGLLSSSATIIIDIDIYLNDDYGPYYGHNGEDDEAKQYCCCY